MKSPVAPLKATFREDSSHALLLASMAMIGLSFGLYKGVLDNYLAEIVAMGEFDRGLTEFFRELPGLLLVGILAALYTLSAETIYKLGSALMILGMGLHGLVPADRLWITAVIFLYSIGEHMQLGMRTSLALLYARPKRGGAAQGLLNASNQIGTLAGYVVVIIAFLFVSGARAFRTFFFLATAATAAGTIISLGMTGKSKPMESGRRFYFDRKFKKFYWLEVFYGARKQVFFTFGPYVLILFYGASTAVISLLFAISAVCCFLASPLVGKLIDRLGYRVVMISDTLILVVVCFFYGFAHHIFPRNIAFLICCVNYILDSVISLASMASNVYVQDMTDDEEEIRATISTGVSVNHLITILIALFGGWIWKVLGIETLFCLSAFLGLCNSAYAASIPRKKREAAPV